MDLTLLRPCFSVRCFRPLEDIIAAIVPLPSFEATVTQLGLPDYNKALAGHCQALDQGIEDHQGSCFVVEPQSSADFAFADREKVHFVGKEFVAVATINQRTGLSQGQLG